ncbi:hypothetical protein R1sor_016682 [Riccia sorocarpa]|uniref:Uncharacterized protein n=1 Tax=Riccia sorocarpa TaxID=122646 RepID=A0ABD3HG39_9MARC
MMAAELSHLPTLEEAEADTDVDVRIVEVDIGVPTVVPPLEEQAVGSLDPGEGRQDGNADGFIPTKSGSQRSSTSRRKNSDSQSTADSNKFNVLLGVEEDGEVAEKSTTPVPAETSKSEGVERRNGVLMVENEVDRVQQLEPLSAELEITMEEAEVQEKLETSPKADQAAMVQIKLSSGCWGDEPEGEEMEKEGVDESQLQLEEVNMTETTNIQQESGGEEDFYQQMDLNRDIIRRSQKEILTEAVQLLQAEQVVKQGGDVVVLSELKNAEVKPFISSCSLVLPHPQKVELGHEVLFAGSPFVSNWSGRAPKKKGSQNLAQSSSQAGKRRVLGSLDGNGLRLSEKHDSGASSMEDERGRERKMRDEGLSQVREVISNMASSHCLILRSRAR